MNWAGRSGFIPNPEAYFFLTFHFFLLVWISKWKKMYSQFTDHRPFQKQMMDQKRREIFSNPNDSVSAAHRWNNLRNSFGRFVLMFFVLGFWNDSDTYNSYDLGTGWRRKNSEKYFYETVVYSSEYISVWTNNNMDIRDYPTIFR